jgi:fibronectin-binding autotransporter adhesin
MSALGGTGSVLGDGNASTLTYNLGGAAVGADYRLDPHFLVGASVGYVTGSQWVNGFDGRGTTDVFNASLYASFASAGAHVDGVAGYANATNRLTRSIAIAGLAARTASGQTGANQFFGQIEGGYKVALDGLAPGLSVTPFARLQGSTTSQAAFAESGAGSLNLLVAPQTTNSLRTTLGAGLRATIRQLDFDFRLGWLHEYADTGRPLTASFAGAPGLSYTVFGAAAQRDNAVVGLSVGAAVASATRLYLRYEGEVGGTTDNHALTAGLRLSW